MKKSGPNRKYTQEFRLAAVKQVIGGGRSIPQVARSLEMSPGTLGVTGLPPFRCPPIRKQESLPSAPIRAEVQRMLAGALTGEPRAPRNWMRDKNRMP